MSTSGMNTAASESVIDKIVKLISFAPLNVASIARLARLHPAHGVFQKHDRVVDEESDGKRERQQREVVDAVMQAIHRQQRDQQRHRQRDHRE